MTFFSPINQPANSTERSFSHVPWNLKIGFAMFVTSNEMKLDHGRILPGFFPRNFHASISPVKCRGVWSHKGSAVGSQLCYSGSPFPIVTPVAGNNRLTWPRGRLLHYELGWHLLRVYICIYVYIRMYTRTYIVVYDCCSTDCRRRCVKGTRGTDAIIARFRKMNYNDGDNNFRYFFWRTVGETPDVGMPQCNSGNTGNGVAPSRRCRRT